MFKVNEEEPFDTARIVVRMMKVVRFFSTLAVQILVAFTSPLRLKAKEAKRKP